MGAGSSSSRAGIEEYRRLDRDGMGGRGRHAPPSDAKWPQNWMVTQARRSFDGWGSEGHLRIYGVDVGVFLANFFLVSDSELIPLPKILRPILTCLTIFGSVLESSQRKTRVRTYY